LFCSLAKTGTKSPEASICFDAKYATLLSLPDSNLHHLIWYDCCKETRLCARQYKMGRDERLMRELHLVHSWNLYWQSAVWSWVRDRMAQLAFPTSPPRENLAALLRRTTCRLSRGYPIPWQSTRNYGGSFVCPRQRGGLLFGGKVGLGAHFRLLCSSSIPFTSSREISEITVKKENKISYEI
jgi:hypothetical protein